MTQRAKRKRCFVYVLGCFEKSRYWTYVGWTNDIDRRLAMHNSGKGARSTRGRAWVLIHSEQFRSRERAMSREWHLKRDRKFRKQLAVAWTSGEGVPS
jgi:putative endonuclease